MNEAKRQLVQSWLTKAQHDLASARVLAASAEPLMDSAIYDSLLPEETWPE
jgi:hypothetical protein